MLSLLIKLNLSPSINIRILKLEIVVLELLRDWHVRIKINWGLKDTIANNALLLLLEEVIVGGHPVVLNEFTWALVEGIEVVSAIIIVILVLVWVLAAWHATNNWHSLIDIDICDLSVKV